MSFSNGLVAILAILAGVGNILGGMVVSRPWKRGESHENLWHGNTLHGLMQLGAGFLLAVTVLETIPYSLANVRPLSWGAPLVLAGYLVIHLFEHTVAPHFHFGEEVHEGDLVRKSAGYSALFGLTVHSIFDGVAIGAAVTLSHTLGWLVFIAILLHKFPEGATSASIAIVAGLGRKVAFAGSVLLAVATLAGVAMVRIGHSIPTRSALAVSAGVTLYVSATDLIPHGNALHDKRMPLLVFVGVIMFVLTDMLLASFNIQ